MDMISNQKEVTLEQLGTKGAFLEAKEWEKFDFNASLGWFSGNWSYSIHLSILYIFVIHAGQFYMRKRDPIKWKNALIWWNIALAVFSIVGFLRTFPELFALLTDNHGFYKSVCSREQQTIVTAFWSLMSAFSKVAELFDTGFVVLRKQPLIFLHWYHHTTVMLFTWFTYESLDPSNRWMLAMNYFIHGIMYSYYALKAAGFKLPRNVSVLITTLQILQMILGVTVNVYTVGLRLNGDSCARRDINVFWGLSMYLSYMVLFGHFFYRNYISNSKSKSKSSVQDKKRD